MSHQSDEPVIEGVEITQGDFRALLDWYMCSDPWPVSDQGGPDSHAVVTNLLHRIAKADGWDDWTDAYHRVSR